MATATTTATTTVASSIHGHVPELDLSALHLQTSVVDRFNETVPGLRTSAAFFAFLRANLALDPATSSVSTETPQLTPFGEPPSPYTIPSASSVSFPSLPFSTSSAASSRTPSRRPSTRAPSEADDIPAGRPRLFLTPVSSPPTKAASLRLIAASIDEDRRNATQRLARHPLALLTLAAVLATAYHLSQSPDRDIATLFVVFSGIIGGYLALAKCMTAGYENAAEAIAPSFLLNDPASGEEDVVIGAMWGSALVGALVLRMEPHHPAHHHHHSLSSSSGSSYTSGSRRHKSKGSIGSLKSMQRRGGKGIVRAWTVSERFRGRGVGTDLLNEAVKMSRDKMGREAEVGFAREHANATRILPEWLDGEIRRRETRAGLALQKLVRDWDARGRRR